MKRTPADVNYLRRLLVVGAIEPGSLISWPACNSASGAIPLRRATSSAESLCAAAIFAIVSPLRARTIVSVDGAFASFAVVGERRQLVRRTVLLGTSSFVADFRSTPGFIVCKVAT